MSAIVNLISNKCHFGCKDDCLHCKMSPTYARLSIFYSKGLSSMLNMQDLATFRIIKVQDVQAYDILFLETNLDGHRKSEK